MLTLLELCPLLPLNPLVLIFDAGLGKDQTGDLSAAAEVEVDELDLGSHFELLCCAKNALKHFGKKR